MSKTRTKQAIGRRDERRRRAIAAAAVFFALAAMGWALFQYLRMGLPYYLHNDEPITTSRVTDLVDKGVIALDYFKYPGLNFYYGVIVETLLKAVGALQALVDAISKQGVVRMTYVLTAWASGLILYFPFKRLLKSRSRAVVGTVLCMYSMYLPGELWYAGPDALLYAFGNIVLCLLIRSMEEQDQDHLAFFLFPLWGIVLGLAISTKYHAALMVVLMLWVFFYKKMYRVDLYKFSFLFSLVLMVLVFVCCNLYMFESFGKFVSDILSNFSHYKNGHQGLDTVTPVLDYALVFFAFGFGLLGGAGIFLATGELIKKKRFPLLISLWLLPVVTIAALGRYKLFLARNISYVMPFANVLFVMGLYTLWDYLKGKRGERVWKGATVIIVGVTMVLNVCSLVAATGYQDSRDVAGAYITENVPEGTTIFTRAETSAYGNDRMPGIDSEKYMRVTSAYDADEGAVVVDTSGRYARFYDHKILEVFGQEMYPESREAYERELEDYVLVARFDGLGLDTSPGNFDKLPLRLWKTLFGNRKTMLWGPTICIYTNTKAPDFSGVALTGKTESIQYTGQKEETVKLHVNNGTGATLQAGGKLATKLSYTITDPSDKVVVEQVVDGALKEDIGPNKEADLEFKCPLSDLKAGENYTLEIDLVKSTTGSYAEKGMTPLRIPILAAQG